MRSIYPRCGAEATKNQAGERWRASPYLRGSKPQEEHLQAEVKKHVDGGSALYSDDLKSYEGLAGEYAHKVIDHAVAYVDGAVRANTLENFSSLLKRGLHGTYVSVEPYHLIRYLDEQMSRYNNRQDLDDRGSFDLAMAQIVGKHLTYAEVTGKNHYSETCRN